MLGAGKPAVDPANMAFRRTRADLGRQERAHRGAGRRFGGKEVDAALAAPFVITLDGIDHRLRPGAW